MRDQDNASAPVIVRRGIGIAGGLAVLIGSVFFVAWMSGAAARWSAAGMITMKTNMALAQVLAGSALLLLAPASVGGRRRWVGALLAAVVLLIGLLLLSQHLFGWNLGIDQLLAREAPGAIATDAPNRVGFPGSVSLTLLGAGLLSALGRRRIAPYLGLAVTLVNLVPAVGFLYGIHQFYATPALSNIAWSTVIALMSLGVGLMLSSADTGLVALLLRDDPGGVLLRRMLPVVVLVPLVLGYLRTQGEQAGLYNASTGRGILVLAIILVFSVILWRSAADLSRSAAAQEEAKSQQAWLASFPEKNASPVTEVDVDGRVRYMNPASKQLLPDLAEIGRDHPWLADWESVMSTFHGDPTARVVREVRIGDSFYQQMIYSVENVQRIRVYGTDITERKRAEQEREITVEFLRLVNESHGTRELVRSAAAFFQQQSGCEAVGIRLREGDDYPYIEARGFPEEFVQEENSLCIRDVHGNVTRDSVGYPIAVCMCGNVISGLFDPSKPLFTAFGSFWTNSTTKLLATTSEADRQSRTRNRCNGEGYESVALIPLRVGELRLGLLQLNDRRIGVFSLEIISRWERLAGYLAVALARSRAEEALRESEERLRAWVTASSDVVYRMSPDWSEMRQLRGRDFIADTETSDSAWLSKYITLEDQPHVSAVIREAIRTKSTFELEHRVLRVDGSLGWTFSRAIPRLDANGEIIEWFGAARDITERKLAEEALRESEERFRTMVDAIPQLAWMANPDGFIFWYNRRWYEYTGTTPEQMEGWGWQSVHDPEKLPKVLERWKASIATGQPFDMEFPLLGSDGRFRVFLTRVTPMKDSEGKIMRWFGTNTDVNEVREIEAHKQEFYRRTILAATEGKLMIAEADEIRDVAGSALRSWDAGDASIFSEIRLDAIEVAESAGMESQRVHKLVTCIGEAVSNAFKHAHGGRASIHRLQDGFLFMVDDDGPGIEALRLPDVALVRGYSTAGTLGMGYKLMLLSSDRVYLATGPTGTTLAVELKLRDGSTDALDWAYRQGASVLERTL